MTQFYPYPGTIDPDKDLRQLRADLRERDHEIQALRPLAADHKVLQTRCAQAERDVELSAAELDTTRANSDRNARRGTARKRRRNVRRLSTRSSRNWLLQQPSPNHPARSERSGNQVLTSSANVGPKCIQSQP